MPGAVPDGPPPRPPITDSGVDVSQIDARLRLGPAERLRLGVAASRRMIALRRRLRPVDERIDADRA